MDTSSIQVAVVGAGPAGLAAIKYLREEGFQVTCFERRSDVGGIWTFSDNPSITSTTPGTRAQSCMTDFPFPEDYPIHVTSPLWSAYYKKYARHFDLYDSIVFNVAVKSVRRNGSGGRKWLVQLESERDPREFDKVVWATGSEVKAEYPDIRGRESFKGQLIHGQAYKRPVDFKDKVVIVLGLGNSAADTAVELVPHASKVYLSHRRGTNIVPRTKPGGVPLDDLNSWAASRFLFWLEYYLPLLYALLINHVFRGISKTAWDRQPREWGFEPAPAPSQGIRSICINDDLIPLVRGGRIASIPSISEVIAPKSVRLSDGTVVEDVDSIIACTGYTADFEAVDGVTYTDCGSDLDPLPDLYHNIFPADPADAQSLAFLNYCLVIDNASTVRELIAMAIAQIWTGKSVLPPAAEMRRQVDEDQDWLRQRAALHPGQYRGKIMGHRARRFIHEAAGTGMYEYLGWGWKAWSFWWQDRKLYNTVAWGVFTPHMYRLFETGKRPAWHGAREAIIRVNKERDRRFRSKGKTA